MRGQQIISKISKFGNFTIRKGIADNDKNGSGTAQNSNKIGVDQPGTDGNSRAPLGQISLNAQPTAAATSNNNNKSKETTKEAPTDEPVLLPTTKKLLHISDAENEVDDNRPQQQKQGQKKLSKKGQLEAIDVAVGGQSSEDKLSTIGPAMTNRHSDEAFVIYADEEEQENEQHQAKDDHGAVFVVGGQTGENDDDDDEGKEWEDAGGWERTTGTDQDYAVLSMRLSLGKENIPPFEKHEILLNFSTSTDDDTPLKDSNKSTSAVAEQKTTTKTTSTSITTKTIKESKKLWGKTTTASTESGVGAGDTSVEWHQGEGESSELGSSAEHNNCPSEYMTALTHHSVKSFVDERGDGSAKRHRRQFKNPMYCAYDADIYRWHLHRERAGRSRNYMPLQSDITEPMRAVLIDWCVDVVTEFELCPATFFLTVSVTDRTLSRVDCPRDKLQLLGAAALLTASKMHEIFPPTIKDIVHATDDCYTEAQVQRMEKIVLKATEFALGFPLVDSFAEFFDYYAPTPLGDVQRHMMWYLLELSTLNFTALHRHLPSRLAAAAFLIASCLPPTKPLDERAAHKKAPAMQKQMGRQMTKQRGVDDKNDEQKQQPQQAVNLESTDPFQQWEVMEQKTQIMRKELIEPVKTLLKLHRQAATTSSLSNAKVKAVRKKFSDARHNRVARMEFPSAIAASQLLCD